MSNSGEIILGYRLISKIGSGGMGSVWRAEHTRLKRRVAIKVLSPQLYEEEEFVARFLKEAEILAALQHPNILAVENVSEAPLAIIMEYIGGGTLEDQMPEEGMSLDAAWPLFSQILDGVSHAHAQGIIHRDLKPANVLITKQGEVKIADFGIAKLSDGKRITKTGVLFGTPAYMSPEQVQATQDLTPASDLYTCAIILYEMLTGRPPFGGPEESQSDFQIMAGHVQRDPPDPRGFNPDVSEPLRAALMCALAKAPEARFESARAFKRALKACLEDPPPSIERPAAEAAPDAELLEWVESERSLRWGKLALGAALLMGVGLYFWLFDAEPPNRIALSAPRDAAVEVDAAPADPPHRPIQWVKLEGGGFMMGSDAGEADERPVHRVTVSPFEASKAEITVGQYRECVQAKACRLPRTQRDDPRCNWGHPGRQDHPINCVDWEQAHVYARWIGARLLTEAEWEYAARSGGLPSLLYPWGSPPPSEARAHFGQPDAGTTPTCGKLEGATRQGLCDMAGNVWEWVEDSYANDYKGTPTDGRAYRSVSVVRVARGGGFRSPAKQLRVTERSGDFANHAWGPGLGFRVAR